MWKDICKSNGLPLDTPYVLRSQKDLLSNNMTWSEKTMDDLWRKIYKKRGLIKTPPVDVLIERKKEFIEQLEKKLAEEDLDECEIRKIGLMMNKTKEDLDELMNPKMNNKKKKFPFDVMDIPMMAMADRRGRLLKRKADAGIEKASKALAKEAYTCF